MIIISFALEFLALWLFVCLAVDFLIRLKSKLPKNEK